MPFVSLAGPDLVNDLACCKDPAIVSCVAASILPSALGKQGSIELPNNIVLKYAGNEGGNKRSYSYLGGEGARATITCSQDKQCYGNAMNAESESFVLEYCGEVGHVWKQLNTEEMRDEEHDIDHEEEVGELFDARLGNNEEYGELDLQTTPISYSIKFYYTREFAAKTADIDNFINLHVTRMNQAYINSLVPLSAFVLCKEEAKGLQEGGTVKQTLDRFAKLKGSIEKLRDTADVAVLLTFSLEQNTCGMANSLTGFMTGDTISVVKKSCVEDSTRNTLAHEIGHSFGLAHDLATLNQQEARPVYPYGTGHLIKQGQSKNKMGFRTIMAYYQQNHQKGVNYFSNPNVILKETLTPTGTGKSDNAQVLLRNRFRIAELGDESSRTCSGGNPYDTDRQTTDEEEEEDEEDDHAVIIFIRLEKDEEQDPEIKDEEDDYAVSYGLDEDEEQDHRIFRTRKISLANNHQVRRT